MFSAVVILSPLAMQCLFSSNICENHNNAFQCVHTIIFCFYRCVKQWRWLMLCLWAFLTVTHLYLYFTAIAIVQPTSREAERDKKREKWVWETRTLNIDKNRIHSRFVFIVFSRFKQWNECTTWNGPFSIDTLLSQQFTCSILATLQTFNSHARIQSNNLSSVNVSLPLSRFFHRFSYLSVSNLIHHFDSKRHTQFRFERKR